MVTLKNLDSRHKRIVLRTSDAGHGSVSIAKRAIDNCGYEVHAVCMKQFGPVYWADLPQVALIGIVRLVIVLPTINDLNDNAANAADRVCGKWSPGRYVINAVTVTLLVPARSTSVTSEDIP
jgi:hypothetical protein